eukprot:CAMPEP_0168555624 /NCGR_PEP_ID=MMETSP0413-20121227/8439_1 /TAXON_ID=136452 /ORGANISM="Filamoeba nolandi, Strain NC-AS-23-1" /LENGTH=477 /DNA_ID=CAMNT_0008586497 /DNA_START=29 /DNA_END=1462 /DNA_ORIENTATION=+
MKYINEDDINPNLANYPKGFKKYWTIHNKRYDVSSFVDRHPGGKRMILQGQGRNCTELFECYHSLSDKDMTAILAKYYVEDATPGSSDYDETYDWNPSSQGGKFWATLKERVRRKLKERGETHKATTTQLVVFLALCGATVAMLPFFFRGYWFSIIALPLLYYVSGCTAMHDGGHSALSKHEWINNLAAIYGSAVSSPFWWQLRHNVGHHEHTNVKGKDPDLMVLTKIIASPWFRKRTAMWIQPAFTSFFLAFFNELFFTTISPRHEFKVLGTFETRDKMFHYLSRFIFFALFIVYPFYAFPLGKAIAFATVPYMIHGVVFFTLSQISHYNVESFMEHEKLSVNPTKEAPKMDEKDKHWAVHQVRHTMDWGIPTPFTVGVSIGLCYQTVHHLFPQVFHMNLGYLQPTVEETCKEFGVQYNWVPTADELIMSYANLLGEHDQGSCVLTLKNGPVVYAVKWIGNMLGQLHPKAMHTKSA